MFAGGSSWWLPPLASGRGKNRFRSWVSFPHLFSKDTFRRSKGQSDLYQSSRSVWSCQGQAWRELAASSYLASVAVGAVAGEEPGGTKLVPPWAASKAALSPLLPWMSSPVSLWAQGWSWCSGTGDMPGASGAELLLCSHWFCSSKKWSDESLEAAAHSECLWQVQS